MILDQLGQVWSQVLGFASQLVIPDWGALIALLPVFIVIGLIGPAVTLAVLGWLVYLVRRPRARVGVADGPIALAPTLPGEEPEVPVGLPYCPRDRLVFDSGATRCSTCHGDLAVVCPMCGLGRAAGISTCGNCGLVLRIEKRPRILRPSGPPPGGAAIA